MSKREKLTYPLQTIEKAKIILNSLPEIDLIPGIHIRNTDELKDIENLKKESPDALAVLLTGGRLKYATPLRDPAIIARDIGIDQQDPRMQQILEDLMRLAPQVKTDDEFDLNPLGIKKILPFYYFLQDIDLVFIDSIPGNDNNWRHKKGKYSQIILDYVHESPSAVIWHDKSGEYFDDIRASVARIKF